MRIWLARGTAESFPDGLVVQSMEAVATGNAQPFLTLRFEIRMEAGGVCATGSPGGLSNAIPLI